MGGDEGGHKGNDLCESLFCKLDVRGKNGGGG